ncbi:helix-turn-helix transcriptional regulator [Nocardioides zhouii]|nr:helix-turn-helix transcriptional regulator [Nocardioides zhouii]
MTGLLAWVVAAGSALLGATAIFIGPHDPLPWDSGLYPLVFGVPGALVASHLPRSPVGWLMLVVGTGFAVNTAGVQYVAEGGAPGAEWWAWWVGRGGGALLVPASLLLVLLLPNGRLPSRRWRGPVAAVVGFQVVLLVAASLTRGSAALDDTVRGAAGLTTPVGLLPESWNTFIEAAIAPALVLPFLLGIPAAFARIRAADSDERPRVTGVLGGVVLFVLLVTLPDLAWPAAAAWFHLAGAAILSAAVLVAALRGHFEQVEVVVSQAFVYGTLTVAVTGAYVALVALAPGLDERLAGVGTAVVALALLPARRVLQDRLRRFVYGDAADRPGTVPAEAAAASHDHRPSASSPVLSRRENEVMRHVEQGMTNNQIAAELFISPVTVRNHVSSILIKLDATNRTQAVARFQASVRESGSGQSFSQ